MGKVFEAIQGVRESANSMTLSPDTLRTAANDTIRSAYSTLRGSGAIMTELGKAGRACVDLPVGIAGNALKACAQLATLQPFKATQTVARGLTSACKSLATMTVAPIPTALAACEGTLKAAGTVAKLPVTVPLAAYRVAGRGINRVLDVMGPSNLPAPVTTNDDAKPPLAPTSTPTALAA